MSEGPQYLLSMAGVNLAAVLDDTSDLSTIRGGGLLLLDAVKQVETQLQTWAPGALTVSKGASAGLFCLPGDADAEALAEDVRKFLREHQELRHFTFVVDVEPMPSEKDFRHAKETVLAKNHWRQMQAPSLAIPQPTGEGPCEETGIRPAKPHENLKHGRRSESFYQRRGYGLTKKQDFYRDQTGVTGWPRFARDFSGIAEDAPKGFGNLEGKMAVIYLDGNSFGDIERSADSTEELRAFDEDLRGKRKDFLTGVLRELNNKKGKKGDENWYRRGRLRLETLLWGGDEMMFVVPAWQGWWFLKRFFKFSKDWKYPRDKDDGTRLHHAAGLVFCHHNAPIARIRDLAKDLAEHVKDLLGKDKKDISGLAYLVLESYDSLGSSVETFLSKTLLPGGKDRHKLWWLTPEAMRSFSADGRAIAEGFPKRRVHRAAQEAAKTGNYGDEHFFDGLEDGVKVAWDKLETCLESEPMPEGPDKEARKKAARALLPLHLALLWDYLPEPDQPAQD